MTNVTNDILKQLRDVFPSSAIQWRVGSQNQDKTRGKALPYIDARVVQNRLDDVLGANNWKNRYTEVIVDGKLLAVRCALAVKIGDEWVEKEDGAHLDNIQNFDDAEKAIKGVYSDAEKRAAVQWGIGRYLYDYEAPWVEISNGRLLETPRLPNEMVPANEHVAASTKQATKPAATEVKQAPAAESKPEAKPEPKQEVKPEPKQEVKPEPKPEPTPEPKPEPVAQATPAAAPADTAREVLAPQSAGPDDEARARADELADQAAAKQPAKQEVKPEPTPAPAAAPAAAQAGGDDDKLPEGITEEQRKLAEEMLTKMTKLPAHMLRGYIDGPKGKEKFTEEVRAFLLKKLAQKEAEAA